MFATVGTHLHWNVDNILGMFPTFEMFSNGLENILFRTSSNSFQITRLVICIMWKDWKIPLSLRAQQRKRWCMKKIILLIMMGFIYDQLPDPQRYWVCPSLLYNYLFVITSKRFVSHFQCKYTTYISWTFLLATLQSSNVWNIMFTGIMLSTLV
jgi:hypothetical protein